MNHTASTRRKRPRVAHLATVALVLALLLTLLSAGALVLTLAQLQGSQREARRSEAVLAAAAELHEAIRAAETGQRGYLLTDEKRYLATYEAGVPRVWNRLQAAQALARDPQQIASLANVQSKVQAKLDELAQTVALHAQSADAALEVVRSDRGQQLMEQIDATLRTVRERGAALSAQRDARAQRDASLTTATAGLTGGLALLSAALGVMVLVRQRARTRIFEAEVRFQNLAENIDDVFWVSNPRTGQTLYINPAFERIWGQPREALYRDGQHWLTAIVPRDRSRVGLSFATRSRQGRYEESYQITRPDGTARWIRDRGWPVQDEDGGFLYMVGIAEDITAMREAREALETLNADLERRVEERTQALTAVNRELDAFAYTISHDLRAPLRSIQGFADALLEDCGALLPEDGHAYAARIIASAERMEDLIEDILTYSRLAQSEINVRQVSLETLIDQVLSDNGTAISEAGARVQVQRPLPCVQGSTSLLRQVLGNLLTNAVKFTALGQTPEVVVRAERCACRIKLWVEDQGIGIADEHQARIFEPFQRLHGIENYSGTGIGLAIVRRAVMRMGGTCGVVSTPGQGSRFWIELPANREERA